MDENFARYPSLEDRVVLVTGGASGIGAEMVAHFAAQGARVGFLDFDDLHGRQVAARTGALFLPCDLRDIAALQAAVGRGRGAARPGHGAGQQRRARRPAWLEEVTPDYWDERMHTNLRHQFFCAQAVAPMMKAAGGGSIINFGSVSWMHAQGGDAGLHHGEGGGAWADARPGARPRARRIRSTSSCRAGS